MSLTTDLSASPYYDDYDPTKNFSKILFKPGPAVQTRELNQLQTLLQAQIERFGDNVFKRGTIVDGCQFTFYDNYPYVKLNDADLSGEGVDVTNYVGLFALDESSGVTARINNSVAGFEATAPDLNTIYVSYIKAGSNGEVTFSPNTSLVITDLDRTLTSLDVQNNVSGFSNTDVVVISPALAVQNSIGGTSFSNGTAFMDVLTPGQLLTQNLTGGQAAAIIVSANSDSVPGSIVLSVRPLVNSLIGASFSNGLFLTQNSFQANSTVPAVVNGAEVFVTQVIGANATARVITTTSGRIESGLDSLRIESQGTGYFVRPHVTVASGSANSTQVSSLLVEPRNFYAKVVVANSSSNSIGSGYAFAVSEGVIYQKGYFSRVEPQLAVVEKYRTTTTGYPDQKVVGFDTVESIVNSNTDFSLLDLANTKNATAPGADRLRLAPRLTVLSSEDVAANTEFFSIVEFAKGNPFKQIQDTRYNAIEAAMAQRTYEATGNFVLDQFLVNTVSGSNALQDSMSFNISVDPGVAYINGRRVSTSNNFVVTANKGTTTAVTRDVNIDINLGNYVEVNQLAGYFPASKMVTVDLYDTARSHYSQVPGSVPASSGTKIGTARVRSVITTDGVMGTPEAKFRMYLFDVVMNTGKNFSNVASIFYNGATYKAVADVVSPATLRETANSFLVFSTKFDSIKTMGAANIEFTVRSSQVNTAANGLSSTASITIAAGPNAYFPYAGQLTDAQLREIIITPNVSVRSNTNITGTISGTSGQTNVTGSGTSFVTELYAGGHLRFNTETKRIQAITNNTHLVLSAAIGSSFSANVAQLELPKDVPISLIDLPNAQANVSANTTLTVGLGFVANIASFGVNATYNRVLNQSSSAAAKTTKRRVYVKIQANTHPQTTTGPWCLGIPDAFRLRNVYRGSNTSSENITSSFYIDNNQNENYLDLSYLIRKPGSKFTVGENDVLLVEFDAFQNPADRPFTVDSYSVNDAIEFASANTTIYTAEIPQFYSIKGSYYDLRDSVDFRPTVEATANVLANTSTATVNPAETRVIDETLDKIVPAPQSDLKFSVESYQARADRVVMTSNGDIRVLSGYPSKSYTPVPEPKDAITIDILNVPPFPSIPKTLNENVRDIYDTKTGSERLLTARNDLYTIVSSPKYKLTTSQNKRYSMAEIAKMDRRLDSVEKAVSLTLVEQKLDSLVIPSSLDENVARFKFGFAVDNFEGLRLADTENPQFNATIFAGRLAPKKRQLTVSYVDEADASTITLPRTADYQVIFQNVATDGPVVLPEPPTPPIPVEPDPPVVFPEPPPIICPPPPRPQITLDTNGDEAHICGLAPGTPVLVTVRHPLTRDIYSQTEAYASAEGCVEAPLISFPPPVEEDPIVCWPPIVDPQSPVKPPVVVEVRPNPPVEPPVPEPPVVIPLPQPFDPIPFGGGGDSSGGWSSFIGDSDGSELLRWLRDHNRLGNLDYSIDKILY